MSQRPSPRGTCPACTREVALIPSSGLIRRHSGQGRRICVGSWEPPERISATAVDVAYRLKAVESVCREREAELLELKGPCSSSRCRLHYAHRGPCDTKAAEVAAFDIPGSQT